MSLDNKSRSQDFSWWRGGGVHTSRTKREREREGGGAYIKNQDLGTVGMIGHASAGDTRLLVPGSPGIQYAPSENF